MITANEAKDLTIEALEESIGEYTISLMEKEIKKATAEKRVGTSLYPLPSNKAFELNILCKLLGYETEVTHNCALGSKVILRWADETSN